MNENRKLDLASIRARLANTHGKEYWRGLDELADTDEFHALMQREYPRYAAIWERALDRRQFLKILGASLALAGLTACGAGPAEQIVPYVRQPAEFVPDEPLYYASAFTLGGYATGVLVENHLGRPTKIEGNPDHPASLGAADIFAQASVLQLYDPDRSQVVTNNGQISTYISFQKQVSAAVNAQRSSKGAGLRILTETVTSPTLADQLKTLLQNYPSAKWHQWEPLGRDNVRAGAKLAFGDYVETVYHVDAANVILSLDADFLFSFPGSVRYAREFSRRRANPEQTPMNRLYVVESTPTITGAKADHRLPLRASDIEAFARSVAQGVGVQGVSANQTIPGLPNNWLPALVHDLQQQRGSSLVIAGESQPPVVHALAHAINDALGNVGKTLDYVTPVEANPTDQMASLRDLAADLNSGQVKLLLILGANPAFTAPADLNFDQLLKKAAMRVHVGLYDDETAALCDWHIPESHYLETWSDARAYDGTVTIMQPLIAPLYETKSYHEVLSTVLGRPNVTSHDIVQNYWKGQNKSGDFVTFWKQVLNAGIVPSSVSPKKSVNLKTDWLSQPTPELAPPAPDARPLEIIFRPDPSIYDGRFANNGWLQELPKPLTKLTWDNAALVSPATAERFNLSSQPGPAGGEHGQVHTDVVELQYQGRTVRAPVWILPGQPDDSVTVWLGYGRTRAGHVANGAGFNAYTLRTSSTPWFGTGLQMSKTGTQINLASTQQHFVMEGRGLIRAATLAEFQKNPKFAQTEEQPPQDSLFPPYSYSGYAWGMTIDLNACIGCNACVIACQAENNIPVVGKEQVMAGREMHWIRIDRYYSGSPDNPATTNFEPVLCMHCEDAPCEVVCPVGATVHSSEGLNEMVYNRCVGTRYCSNNCPYKVRRFNFLQFSDYVTPSLKLQRNPEVTVRTRGVMEKCSYCVQRIVHARTTAEKENRQIQDGEIVTACQATCPTQAIVFGNMNDPNSRVAKVKAGPRNYALLGELNTRPHTTYEAEVRNPNPEIG